MVRIPNLATRFLTGGTFLFLGISAHALDGGTVRITPSNGWKTFEVISEGDNPAGGANYVMPDTFDGTGALWVDASTLRLQVNHETGDATISEVNVNLPSLQLAINNMINTGNTGGISFVTSAQQAYVRWSSDGGSSWTNTSDTSNTSFYRFCSGQSYEPDTFGVDRGFVNHLYITGEEGGTHRLFVLDSATGDFYQLSGVVGDASGVLGGIGGMPYDAFENAALMDTGETQHVALVLSPDGGTQRLQLYIGIKGKDVNGNNSNSFLARNGLAYGSYFYFNDGLPAAAPSTDGFFDATATGALTSTKLEDVDTSPSFPTRFVLGDQDSGAFVFDINLDFTGSTFNAAASGFSITRIDAADGSMNSHDNVDWTGATNLGGVSYPEGLIFVNEDNSTGEIWYMEPDGSNQVKVGETSVGTESSGIFDLSGFLGYKPASILMTTNQGSPASLTILINPDAELLATSGITDNDFNNDGTADVLLRSTGGNNWRLFNMSGGVSTANSAYAAYTSAAWQLVASEDFDADGDTDILLRNTSSGAWRMFITENGAVQSDSNFGAYANLSWEVASVADYNGDSIKDILLHSNAGGGWRVFYVSNGTTASNASMALYASGWDLKYDGDMDGDGDADIILRRASDGYWRQFTVAGGVVASNSATGLYQSLNWQIQFVSDLDNDGDDDIVMRNVVSGFNWRTFAVNSGAVGANSKLSLYENAAWSFNHLNDVDADGDDDIVLRSNTGGWRLFLTDGLDTPANSALGLYANSAWVKADVVDVDGDGTKDVILNNTLTGAWRAFMISGAVVSSDTNPGLYQNTDWTLQNK